MNPSSKSNSDLQIEKIGLGHFLREPVTDGKGIVRLSRQILQAYSAMGCSIDDPEVENILGIESETDTMDLESGSSSVDFEHVYRIYKVPFEESRQRIRARLEMP